MAEYETYRPGADAPRPRKQKRRRRPVAVSILLGVLKVLGTLLLIGVCTGALIACFAVVYVQNVIIPQADLELTAFEVSQSSVMYYKDKHTGEDVEMVTLYEEDSQWVKYADIPEDLVNATIAIEDKRFRQHHGVDWLRTGKAILLMFTGGDIQGGSTLTQQLIKNVTGNNEVTVKRKVLEIFQALEYDKKHSKDDIMEWYLNFIYLGEHCRGVSAAAMNYFGKELDELTLAECASLISITNNPYMYNPYRFPEQNLKRRNLVLDMMCEEKMITEAERDAAKAEPLDLKRAEGTSRETEIYSWYEDQVISEVKKDLKEKYNYNDDYINRLLYNGGLRIETCFDPEVQAYVDAVYQDRETMVLDSANGQEIQSAVTVIDNATGYVVAVSGGIGEKTGSRWFNRATDTVRPPGSSIKPLAVYAPALDMGLITPATVVDDSPILWNGEVWPSNSYNYYRGLTTVGGAVQDSINTIAVRVLLERVTTNTSYQYMTERFGISSLVLSKEVGGQIKTDVDPAPLALGGLTEGVSTYEMAAAYATFANNGVYREPHTYLRVTDMNENVLLENDVVGRPVISESAAYYMNTMLQNVIKHGTGTVANFSGMTIAGKTGTTTSNNDKWFVGYSPYYTAAVWVGYDTQERIPSTAYLGAEMWKKVMEPLHANLENKDFYTPGNLVSKNYCRDSGLLATDLCEQDPRGSRVVSGTFVNGDQPTAYCTVHHAVEICTESPVLDADGQPIEGMYHIASESCPEESRKTIALLDYNRDRANESVVTRDDPYLLSKWEEAGGNEPCEVHSGTVGPEVPFNPYDPSTWPVDDPFFDPLDPHTWPIDDPGFDPDDPGTWPQPPVNPGPGGQEGPEVSPQPSPGGTEEPTVPPEESPEPSTPPGTPAGPEESPLPDEPYVPAQGGR